MQDNEKRKNRSRPRFTLIWTLLVLAISAALIALYLLNKDDAPDIFFLFQDGTMPPQVYGLNLDLSRLEDAKAIPITSDATGQSYIRNYAVHGDWLLYSQSQVTDDIPEAVLILMNWRSGEKKLLLDCSAFAIDCTESILHFSSDGETVFLEDPSYHYPLTVWMMDTNSTEPEIFVQMDAIASINWLSDTHFIYKFGDERDNSHEMLYDIDTRSAIDLGDYPDLYGLGIEGIIGISASQQSLLAYLREGNAVYLGRTGASIKLINLASNSSQSYLIPNITSDFSLAWLPDDKVFFYYDNSLFQYDWESETSQALWTSQVELYAMAWTPNRSQFVFTGGDYWRNNYATDYQLWLYDLETQEALPLPAIGHAVQWLD